MILFSVDCSTCYVAVFDWKFIDSFGFLVQNLCDFWCIFFHFFSGWLFFCPWRSFWSLWVYSRLQISEDIQYRGGATEHSNPYSTLTFCRALNKWEWSSFICRVQKRKKKKKKNLFLSISPQPFEFDTFFFLFPFRVYFCQVGTEASALFTLSAKCWEHSVSDWITWQGIQIFAANQI